MYQALIQVIQNNNDVSRWNAIEQLLDSGHTLKNINKDAGFGKNYLNKWRYRNKKKYKSRTTKKSDDNPSLTHRKPTTNDGKSSIPIDTKGWHAKLRAMTDDEIDTIPYGEIPPLDYTSDLSHLDWGIHYLKHTWDMEYLKEMADELWNKMKLLLLTGRFHGKTLTMIKLFIRWLLEIQTQVIVVCNPVKYLDILEGVRDGLQLPAIRRDYGDVIDWKATNSKSAGVITFVSSRRFEPSGALMQGGNFMIVPASPDATQVGKHAQGGWLHLEDVTQDLKVSDDAEKRIWHWFDRTIKFIAGRTTKLTATGTRKDPKDFYYHLEENHHFPMLVQKAFVIENGRLPRLDEISVNHEYEIITDWPHTVGTYSILGCPEYPLEHLLYLFIFHADAAEAELNNSPLPRTGNYFKNERWIEMPLPDNWQKYPKYIVMDPGFGGSSTSSKTAIIVMMIYNKRIYIIDMFIDHASVDQKEQLLVSMYENFNPKFIYIENNFGQISTRYSSKSRLMNLRGLQLFNAVNDKKERIAALDFPFMKQEIVIYEDCRFKTDLKSEYLQFSMEDGPTVIRQKYNALDALSAGYEFVKTYLSGTPYVGKTWNSKR